MSRLCQSQGCSHFACPYRLRHSGVPLPDMCCKHSDDFMASIADEVPPHEGESGLEHYRKYHEFAHALLVSS